MNEILRANIFFLLTGSAVMVLSIIFAVALVYVILILRSMREILSDVKDITAKARTEAGFLSQDLADLRTRIKTEGARITHFVDFFKNIINRKRVTGKRSKRSNANE